jgi:hypothetical protein
MFADGNFAESCPKTAKYCRLPQCERDDHKLGSFQAGSSRPYTTPGRPTSRELECMLISAHIRFLLSSSMQLIYYRLYCLKSKSTCFTDVKTLKEAVQNKKSIKFWQVAQLTSQLLLASAST